MVALSLLMTTLLLMLDSFGANSPAMISNAATMDNAMKDHLMNFMGS
jgi:hypothetical protein